MNAERLINLIEAPNSIKGVDLDDLTKLLKKHPFFGIGHLLYLNGLRLSDENLYQHHLNKSAIKIADRSVLFQLINDLDKESTPETHSNQVSANIEEEIPLAPEAPVTQDQLVEKTNESTETKISAVSLEEIFAGVHDEPIEEFTDEQQELPELLKNQQNQEIGHLTEEPNLESVVTELDEITSIEAGFSETLPVEPPTESTATLAEVKPEEQPTPMPSNQMKLGSFNNWLKQHLEEKNQTEQEPKSPNPDAIIEKFIATEPKLSKPKLEFFTPQAMSKKSVIDNESIVSETLAKIYAEQGDYDKAISAYKKLSLEKPEKSTYFAALIYELELKQSLE